MERPLFPFASPVAGDEPRCLRDGRLNLLFRLVSDGLWFADRAFARFVHRASPVLEIESSSVGGAPLLDEMPWSQVLPQRSGVALLSFQLVRARRDLGVRVEHRVPFLLARVDLLLQLLAYRLLVTVRLGWLWRCSVRCLFSGRESPRRCSGGGHGVAPSPRRGRDATSGSGPERATGGHWRPRAARRYVPGVRRRRPVRLGATSAGVYDGGDSRTYEAASSSTGDPRTCAS